MPFDPKDPRHLVIAIGLSALGGAAIVQSHHEEAAKSQAERDDADGCAWLCDLIWDLLDDWEPEDCDSEDEYTDDLVDFLRVNLETSRPRTAVAGSKWQNGCGRNSASLMSVSMTGSCLN